MMTKELKIKGQDLQHSLEARIADSGRVEITVWGDCSYEDVELTKEEAKELLDYLMWFLAGQPELYKELPEIGLEAPQ